MSYLGRAIDRQKVGGRENISESYLIELINVSLVAANDTTSSLLSWNFIHLEINVGVQKRLHSEIVNSISEHGGILSSKSLSQGLVPYLHAVIRESHLLTPAARITCMKENSVSDVKTHFTVVPRGSLFALDGHYVGIDP